VGGGGGGGGPGGRARLLLTPSSGAPPVAAFSVLPVVSFVVWGGESVGSCVGGLERVWGLGGGLGEDGGCLLLTSAGALPVAAFSVFPFVIRSHLSCFVLGCAIEGWGCKVGLGTGRVEQGRGVGARPVDLAPSISPARCLQVREDEERALRRGPETTPFVSQLVHLQRQRQMEVRRCALPPLAFNGG
jgi:hypothetical protein